MKFTIQEKKLIFDTVKYDIYTTSYAVLKENGLPVFNMDINVNNKNLFENYFNINTIKEGFGKDVLNTFLTFAFLKLLKTTIKISIALGISHYFVSKATNLINNNKSSNFFGDENESIFAKIFNFIIHINYLIIEILQKIGLSEFLAYTIAPTITITTSVTAIYIIFKLLKLIIAWIKKFMENNKKNEEVPKEEVTNLANISLKMQKETVSKIEDKNEKIKAQKELNIKEIKLKKAMFNYN